MRADQLRHVLVAGGDDRRPLQDGGLARQGADDIVRLHAGHEQQRHAHGADDVVNRRDLLAQVVRHGRAVGLVVGVQVVAEGLALGVENDGNGAAGIVGGKLAQHGDDAPHRPGRAAVRGLERRQGVVGAKQVGGPVHQDQGVVILSCRCFCHYSPMTPAEPEFSPPV